MAAIYQTKHGAVMVSRPYFSFVLCREAIDLTLIKPENEQDGWGVSCPFRSDIELTPDLLQSFANDAMSKM